MRLTLLTCIAVFFSTTIAFGQCFNRPVCGDGSQLDIHSQINMSVPIGDQASTTDVMKIVEDTRHDLYALANRECDTLKSIFGGECTLASVNLSSSIQDRGNRSRSAMIGISSTYEVKKSK